MIQQQPFNIQDYEDALTPDSSNNNYSYLCPVCGANNFKIDPKTHKYNCFSCDCMATDSGKLNMVKAIAALKPDLNNWQKPIRPKKSQAWGYKNTDGQVVVEVSRFDDGTGKKKIYQKSLVDGKEISDFNREILPLDYQEIMRMSKYITQVFWVEGETKAKALGMLGLTATTTIGGSKALDRSNWQGLFPGMEIIVCPDRDKPGMEYAQKILAAYPDAKILKLPPSQFYWDKLPANGGADIEDWIDERKAAGDEPPLIKQKINDAIESYSPEISKVVEVEIAASTDKEEISAHMGRSKNKYHWDRIEAAWSDQLEWNEMTLRVEKDGKDYDLEMTFLDVARELDLDCPSKIAEIIVKVIAKRNSYHPFREYLKSIAKAPGIDISNLASRYLGNDSPLANTMLKKTLIAAVRRAFNPGCKVDTVCIFKGKTGYRKSTFWEVLASPQFFCDNLSEGNRKDEKLKLSRYAIIEYAEIETVWKQKDVSEMKSFLSSRVDSIRPPYGRSLEDIPRTSIFVGTTNKQEFLSDPTGERRYWVIEVNQRIEIEALEKERNQIWAEAVRQCLAGQIHYLTVEEDIELEQSNKEFKASDTWEEAITEYVNAQELTEITVRELLTKALNLEDKEQRRVEQMRCSDILQTAGWIKGRRQTVDGKKTQLWKREIKFEKGMSGTSGTSTESVNLDTAIASENQKTDVPRTYLTESPQGTSTTNQPQIADVPQGTSTQKNEVRPVSNPDSARITDTADVPDVPISTLEKIHTVLTQAEQKQLSPSELTKHFDWQVFQLLQNSPRTQIFQDLIPVVPDGALKYALLRTDNKTGARARQIDKELDIREKTSSKIPNGR